MKFLVKVKSTGLPLVPVGIFLALALGGSLFAQSAAPDGFVRIKGGTFTMGSPSSEAGHEDGEVRHKVTVSDFSMGKYEVTQAEYEALTGTNPSNFKGAKLPVEQVSWYDAVEYCNRRSEKEGLTPAYTVTDAEVIWNKNAAGYRLPTEAEWEYACRAGFLRSANRGIDWETLRHNPSGFRLVRP
jgi:formylglycine-generating enzyme required for sulfatase activity